MIEQVTALVEFSDDDDLDLTSEVTPLSSSCDRVSVSNLIHAYAPHDENPGNSGVLASGIPIPTLVHSTKYENIMVNNNSDKSEGNQSHKETTRDDESFYTSQSTQRPNHQIKNNELMRKTSMRN